MPVIMGNRAVQIAIFVLACFPVAAVLLLPLDSRTDLWELEMYEQQYRIRYDLQAVGGRMSTRWAPATVDVDCFADLVRNEVALHLVNRSRWYLPLTCQKWPSDRPATRMAVEEGAAVLARLEAYSPVPGASSKVLYRERVWLKGDTVIGEIEMDGRTFRAQSRVGTASPESLDCARWVTLLCASQELSALTGGHSPRIDSIATEAHARAQKVAEDERCQCVDKRFMPAGLRDGG